ncbi:hypothetical protein V6B14_12740 [Sporosarcina psychrophila]|uniref:hypothetical protein n=1 Tax=Sporosarcina psychrophila TaxID=1476 RepID=UPI0030D0F5EB
MRKIKTTSFSRDNEYEKRLLAHAESKTHGDYSNYIKRLIGRDMEGQPRPSVAMFADVPIAEVTDDFSGFI